MSHPVSLRTAALLNHACLVEQFITDEMELLYRSVQPNPNSAELRDLVSAEVALESARELIVGLRQKEEDTFAAGSVEWQPRAREMQS